MPTPFAIYPPKGSVDDSWHLPIDLMTSHHDEGCLHTPLHVDGIADPEPIERLLDIDLGRCRVTPAGRAEAPFNGDQLAMMINITAQTRKELVCPPYYEQYQTQGFPPCECTFRKQFLNRWLCLHCYDKDLSSDIELHERYACDESGHIPLRKCRCGCDVTPEDDYSIICNWCQGSTMNDDKVEVDEGDAEIFRDNGDEEENAASEREDLRPGHMGFVANKDGTLSAFCEGKRISGERLGYQLVRQSALVNNVDVGCACCTCPGRGCSHDHAHGDGEKSDEEQEDPSIYGDGSGSDYGGHEGGSKDFDEEEPKFQEVDYEEVIDGYL